MSETMLAQLDEELTASARDMTLLEALLDERGGWMGQLDAQQATITRLRAALERYGDHAAECPRLMLNRVECECGFSAALAASREGA